MKKCLDGIRDFVFGLTLTIFWFFVVLTMIVEDAFNGLCRYLKRWFL